MVRQPVVAGRFYTDDPDMLTRELASRMPARGERKVLGLVAPHAGYMYSGNLAGKVFGEVHVPDRVVVICPNHTGLGVLLSVWPDGAWQTPLGSMPVDEAFVQAITAEGSPFERDSRAHLQEHSIEVQLPFLQTRNPKARLVAICLSGLDKTAMTQAAGVLAQAIQHSEGETLLVSSSDMNHYESQQVTLTKDRLAMDAFFALDAPGLLDVVRRERISMCGALPTAVMLQAALALGATNAESLGHCTSGDISGDTRQVVGYFGGVVW